MTTTSFRTPANASRSQALSPIELLLKYDKPVPRYTSYPTAAAFTAAVGESQLRAQLGQPSEEPLSLYVDVPFCRHACWYCGCNRVTTQLGSKVAAAMPRRRRLAQLGGGGGAAAPLDGLAAGGGLRERECGSDLRPASADP